MVVAKQKDIDAFIEIVGKVSTDLFIESEADITTKILSVTKKTATHKTLAQLDLYNQYDVRVTRVIRSGLEILAQPSLELYYGDTLMVVGDKQAIHEAEKIIGNSKKILLEPDFLSLFGGFIFGVIIRFHSYLDSFFAGSPEIGIGRRTTFGGIVHQSIRWRWSDSFVYQQRCDTFHEGFRDLFVLCCGGYQGRSRFL